MSLIPVHYTLLTKLQCSSTTNLNTQSKSQLYALL